MTGFAPPMTFSLLETAAKDRRARAAGSPGDPGPTVRAAHGWTLHEHGRLASTNDAAEGLPPWHAVRAEQQTAGRGRLRRAWVSDRGGLWLSAVVPAGSPERGWAALPLAAGLAVCEALSAAGATGLRIRWPNDILAGRRKLAGLLVDQFSPDCAVVGIGINVDNHPEAEEAALAGATVTLRELAPRAPAAADLAFPLLRRLREVVEILLESGFAALAPRLAPWWQTGIQLEVERADARWTGTFLGVDGMGRLEVRTPDGATWNLGAHEVLRVRETTTL
jgi:BirA family biotin operon repressor/biotin-[acetyl-CoA-carboxylase] ligase